VEPHETITFELIGYGHKTKSIVLK